MTQYLHIIPPTNFYPCNAMLVHLYAMALMSVHHKLVFYQNGWMDQTGFYHKMLC